MRHDTWMALRAVCCLAMIATGAIGCRGSDAKDPPALPPLALTLTRGATSTGDLFLRPRTSGEFVTATLTNVGTVPAFVNSRLLVGGPTTPREIALEFLGPDKRPRTFRSLVNASATSRSWQRLEPGASVSVVVDLEADYDLSMKGYYDVQATYENAQDAPAGASDLPSWKGRVVSPVLRFERN